MKKSETIEKAELLADAIARSPERAELLRREEALTADQSAQQLIAELQIAHAQFIEKQQSGIKLTEADGLVVDEIERKVKSSPVIADYLIAQNTFTEMLQSVNAILAGAIAGSSGGCSCEEENCNPDRCATGGSGSGGCGC
ncbi:MAG: YlbF family regulator [Desulfosporosinus sp.]